MPLSKWVLIKFSELFILSSSNDQRNFPPWPSCSISVCMPEAYCGFLCRNQGNVPGSDGHDDETGQQPGHPLLRGGVAQGLVSRRRQQEKRPQAHHRLLRRHRWSRVRLRQHTAGRYKNQNAGKQFRTEVCTLPFSALQPQFIPRERSNTSITKELKPKLAKACSHITKFSPIFYLKIIGPLFS